VTPEYLSKVRAELSCLSKESLKKYKMVLVKLGKAAATAEAAEITEETLRIVDYMLDEAADLEF
jgi:hypothetical protein